PIQHDSLTPTQLARIGTLQQVFSDVDETSLDKWIEDFKRDQDLEREIRIYEGMAEAYRAYCADKTLTAQAKRDVYQVVLLRSGRQEAEVIGGVTLQPPSVSDAREVLRLYRVPPAPISVSTASPLNP